MGIEGKNQNPATPNSSSSSDDELVQTLHPELKGAKQVPAIDTIEKDESFIKSAMKEADAPLAAVDERNDEASQQMIDAVEDSEKVKDQTQPKR